MADCYCQVRDNRLLEASWSADRGRWLQKGATRTPALKQPKPHGPGAPAARHPRDMAARACNAPCGARSGQAPIAVGRLSIRAVIRMEGLRA